MTNTALNMALANIDAAMYQRHNVRLPMGHGCTIRALLELALEQVHGVPDLLTLRRLSAFGIQEADALNLTRAVNEYLSRAVDQHRQGLARASVSEQEVKDTLVDYS